MSAKDNLFEASHTSETSQTSVKTLTVLGTGVPTYINIELKPRKDESSDSEIDEDMLKPPGERVKPDPYPVATATVVKDTPPPTEAVKSVRIDPPTPFDDPPDMEYDDTLTEQEVQEKDDTNDEPLSPFAVIENEDRERTPPHHNYANLEFAQVHNLLSQAPKAAAPSEDDPTSPKGPKKPMPIQRKYKSTAIFSQAEVTEETSSNPVSGSPVRNPVVKKPAPPVKPPNLLNQETDSTVDSSKFQRTVSPNYSAAPSGGGTKALPALSKFLAANSVTSEGRTKDDSMASTSVSTAPPPSSTKPRSYTTVEKLSSYSSSSSSATPTSPSEKKQPILPPATRFKSRSRSPSPAETPVSTQPPSQQVTKTRSATELKIDKVVVAPASTVAVKKAALKPQISEPGMARNRPSVTTPATLNRANKGKPTYTAYGGKFPRTVVGGASTTGNNHAPSSNANSGQDELMKKLTLRRQRIDEQLGVTTKSTTASYTSTKTSSPVPRPSPPSLSPKTPHRVSAPLGHKSPVSIGNSSIRSGEISSERNSTISTSSSDVVVTYRQLDESPSLTSLSSNGTAYSIDGGGSSGMVIRKAEDPLETNLAKYGIIEEGGSYVI